MQKLPSRLRRLVEMGQRADATHRRRVKTQFGWVLASASLVAPLGVVAVPAAAVDPDRKSDHHEPRHETSGSQTRVGAILLDCFEKKAP
jgi:hypothetical protein